MLLFFSLSVFWHLFLVWLLQTFISRTLLCISIVPRPKDIWFAWLLPTYLFLLTFSSGDREPDILGSHWHNWGKQIMGESGNLRAISIQQTIVVHSVSTVLFQVIWRIWRSAFLRCLMGTLSNWRDNGATHSIYNAIEMFTYYKQKQHK